MRFGFIQGVAIWEKDMVAVIFILFHSIPLGGSGSSETSAVPPSLGSTFSQLDSGVLS